MQANDIVYASLTLVNNEDLTELIMNECPIKIVEVNEEGLLRIKPQYCVGECLNKVKDKWYSQELFQTQDPGEEFEKATESPDQAIGRRV